MDGHTLYAKMMVVVIGDSRDPDTVVQLPTDKPVRTAEDYHIRVLVPCYKESLQILQVGHARQSTFLA